MSILRRIAVLMTSSDAEHFATMRKTGFWGKRAAGCIFLAKDSKQLLIAHRTNDIAWAQEPGTWATWGGALDSDEKPVDAVKREVIEEAEYRGPLKLIPLYVFSKKRDGKTIFRYFNFLAIVPHEFTPKLNRETQGYKWVKYGDWPQPLHDGLVKLLHHAPSVAIIQREIGQTTAADYEVQKAGGGRAWIKLWYNPQTNKIIDSSKINHALTVQKVPQLFGITDAEIKKLQKNPEVDKDWNEPTIKLANAHGWVRVSFEAPVDELAIQSDVAADVLKTARKFVKEFNPATLYIDTVVRHWDNDDFNKFTGKGIKEYLRMGSLRFRDNNRE